MEKMTASHCCHEKEDIDYSYLLPPITKQYNFPRIVHLQGHEILSQHHEVIDIILQSQMKAYKWSNRSAPGS